MNKQKQTYLSPETETLVVRFEGGILYNSIGANGVEQSTVKSGNAIGFDDWDD